MKMLKFSILGVVKQDGNGGFPNDDHTIIYTGKEKKMKVDLD